MTPETPSSVKTSNIPDTRVQSTVANDFEAPHSVQFVGSPMARRLLALLGWRVDFNGLPKRQGVIVAYPHTSNWDFVIAIVAKWAIGLSVQFWGKDSLFKVPVLGAWLRWLGGIPVVRTTSSGIVENAIAALQKAQQEDRYMWVALAPEGTRGRTQGWRSGFYQTVVGAGVPLGLAHLDFGKKRVVLLDFVALTGQVEHDMARIGAAFEDTKGCRASLASPIALLPQRASQQDSIST